MIPLANIVYLLYKKTPKKFIIAGDPFQIEPIIAVDEWKNENIYTMVKLDSFTDPVTEPHQYHVELLTTQYRSIPEIGEIFSRFAYGGILKHFRSAKSQRSLVFEDFIDIKTLNIIKFPVSKFESIYRPKRLQGKTPYQVYSALFAFEFVKHLSSKIALVKGDEEFRIGLIAPYRAQADLIDKLLNSIILPKNIDVQVGTIHGFQGDECDIIIALFNPPPSISTHRDMFLNKLNIVNVSISRAKDYLFILMPDDDTENIENLSLIKKIERLCKEQLAWGERLSPTIEEMMFGSKTYLEDNSFSTSHQLVNIYGRPEKRYEVRSEENAVDVQLYE
jgi:superfamily I DNA and/or RNA helicase